MNEKFCNTIYNIVEKIDKKTAKLKEEYKKTPQYKNSKKYRQNDRRYLERLIERRNTLVSVLNYDYTKDIKELEELLDK